jgi:hypothetical protein
MTLTALGREPALMQSVRLTTPYSMPITDIYNTDSDKVAQAFGYTLEQLQSIPSEAHMGLSCGNPVAAATIKEASTQNLSDNRSF